jgi:hypothetical protein
MPKAYTFAGQRMTIENVGQSAADELAVSGLLFGQMN